METSPNIYNAVHLNDRGKFLVDIVVGKHSRANNIKAGVSRLRVIVEVTQLEPLSDGTIERERRIEINTITVDRQLMALNTNLGASILRPNGRPLVFVSTDQRGRTVKTDLKVGEASITEGTLERKRQPAITFWSVGMSATMAAWRSAGSAFGCPVGRGM